MRTRAAPGSRVSHRDRTRRPTPAGPPAARTGHHPLPWQQRLPHLVSQIHHARDSHTYTVTHLTCANNPTVANYCCRSSVASGECVAYRF